MVQIPLFTTVFFAAVTVCTVWLFWRASGYKTAFLIGIACWVLVQTIAALSGFYAQTEAFPPRVFLQVAPALLVVVWLFLFRGTRRWMDTMDYGRLTLLHTARIGAEITIFGLYASRLMPEELTFEGRNWDILAGVTAPLVYYWGYVKKRIGRTGLLLWNLACLVLLLNIVIHAALAVPTPFQQIGFLQPNVAILHFPFNLLPAVVVPLVLFAHLLVIRHLLIAKRSGTAMPQH